MLTPLDARTKTTAVVDALRKQILDGRLPPGTPLLQENIAKRLGVSPTPVREAFVVLESEGLVQRRPHRGVIVALARDIDPWERLLTLEVRAVLERHAIARLIEADETGVIPRLAELVRIGETSLADHDKIELRRSISEFHRVLADGLGSELHTQILLQLSSRTQFYPHMLTQRQLIRGLDAHRALVIALQAGDESVAQAEWAGHAAVNARVLYGERQRA